MKRLSFLLIPFLYVLYLGCNNIPLENLHSNSDIFDSLKRKIRVMALNLKKDYFSNDHVPLSEKEIDILIPFEDKDLKTLECTIDAAKGLVMHPINKVFLVGNESEEIKGFAKKKQCEFVNIEKILPKFCKKKSIQEDFLKEYIKLNADLISDGKVNYCLIIDHGVVLLQTQVFVRKDRQLISFSDKYNLQNKLTTESVLNIRKYVKLNFNHSPIMFDKKVLKEIKKKVEKNRKILWRDAIQEYAATKYFSASEIYANYLLHYHKDKVVIMPGRSLQVDYYQNCGAKWQRGFLSSKYKSIEYKKVTHARDTSTDPESIR